MDARGTRDKVIFAWLGFHAIFLVLLWLGQLAFFSRRDALRVPLEDLIDELIQHRRAKQT